MGTSVGNVIWILLTLTGFAVVHSLTAGSGLKRLLQKMFGERFAEGWRRLAYNLISVLTIAPSPLLLALLPDRVLYVVPRPYVWLTLGIQGIGTLGFLWGLFSVDVWRFMGVRQALAYLTGEPLPLPEETLQEGGIYGIVRHPLYFFGMLMFWPVPVMTLNLLVFDAGVTLYLVIGSLIEERRLLSAYGETYRRYRQRVPWLIPRSFPKWSRK